MGVPEWGFGGDIELAEFGSQRERRIRRVGSDSLKTKRHSVDRRGIVRSYGCNGQYDSAESGNGMRARISDQRAHEC